MHKALKKDAEPHWLQIPVAAAIAFVLAFPFAYFLLHKTDLMDLPRTALFASIAAVVAALVATSAVVNAHFGHRR